MGPRGEDATATLINEYYLQLILDLYLYIHRQV